MVTAGCLIPENFPGASRFLSVKGRPESPPPTVVVGTVMAGLALFSAAVSNGTARVTVLSRYIGSSGGGAWTRDITGSVRVIVGPIGMDSVPSGIFASCIALICHICASKSA